MGRPVYCALCKCCNLTVQSFPCRGMLLRVSGHILSLLTVSISTSSKQCYPNRCGLCPNYGLAPSPPPLHRSTSLFNAGCSSLARVHLWLLGSTQCWASLWLLGVAPCQLPAWPDLEGQGRGRGRGVGKV